MTGGLSAPPLGGSLEPAPVRPASPPPPAPARFASDAVSPPAAPSEHAADSLFRTLALQFTLATGWRLEFEREGSSPGGASHASSCWDTLITDGLDPVGRLRLHTPRGETTCTFLQASELAAGLASVLKSLAECRRRLANRTSDLSTLVNLGLTVPVRENLPWSLSQLLRGAVRLTGAHSAAFFLLDPSLETLRLRAVWQIAAGDVPTGTRKLTESAADRQALLRGSSQLSAARDLTVLPRGCKTGLCVAVESETMPLGTLWIFDRRARTFSERDRHVLQSIAAQIAAVLERVALLRGHERHARIARELEQATQSQPSVLPTDLPADPRYELAAHVTSCNELGGDLCEVIPLPRGHVGLAVGDASGHNIAASLIMASVRGALRAFPGDEETLPTTLRRLNEALYSITRSHQFMSLCYGIFDPGPRRFTYINAGHPLPLLLRQGEIINLASHGLLLGVIRDVEYPCSTIELLPGDVLVLYSDGISEARSGQQQMFRPEGVAEALRHAQDLSARDVLESIWTRVEHHLAGGVPDDDRTLVVLRVK